MTGAEETPGLLRHVTQIIIVSPRWYATFKRFVLQHTTVYAAAFELIDRLAK